MMLHPFIYRIFGLKGVGIYLHVPRVQKLKAFQHFICHTLRHTDTDPASLFHREDLLSGQNDSSAYAYADTHIHNHV